MDRDRPTKGCNTVSVFFSEPSGSQSDAAGRFITGVLYAVICSSLGKCSQAWQLLVPLCTLEMWWILLLTWQVKSHHSGSIWNIYKHVDTQPVYWLGVSWLTSTDSAGPSTATADTTLIGTNTLMPIITTIHSFVKSLWISQTHSIHPHQT